MLPAESVLRPSSKPNEAAVPCPSAKPPVPPAKVEVAPAVVRPRNARLEPSATIRFPFKSKTIEKGLRKRAFAPTGSLTKPPVPALPASKATLPLLMVRMISLPVSAT